MEVPVVGIVAVSRSRGLFVAGAGIILMGRHPAPTIIKVETYNSFMVSLVYFDHKMNITEIRKNLLQKPEPTKKLQLRELRDSATMPPCHHALLSLRNKVLILLLL